MMMSKASSTPEDCPTFISAHLHVGYYVPVYLIVPCSSCRRKVTWSVRSVVIDAAKSIRFNAMLVSPRSTGELMDIADTKRPC
jgi:hypothetical protein